MYYEMKCNKRKPAICAKHKRFIKEMNKEAGFINNFER
jgi:hypothetical protein